jgi:hypothetical protein
MIHAFAVREYKDDGVCSTHGSTSDQGEISFIVISIFFDEYDHVHGDDGDDDCHLDCGDDDDDDDDEIMIFMIVFCLLWGQLFNAISYQVSLVPQMLLRCAVLLLRSGVQGFWKEKARL